MEQITVFHLVFLWFGKNLNNTFLITIFCLSHVSGYTSKTKDTIRYPNLPLALRPTLHGEGLCFRKRPELWNLEFDELMDWNGENKYEYEEYVPTDLCPYLIMQPELNNLTHDLNLFKIKAEVTGKECYDFCLLQPCKISLTFLFFQMKICSSAMMLIA